MSSVYGYCDGCEYHTNIKHDHYCKICYKSYCEDCYFEQVYEDDMCNSCFDDMEISCKLNIKGNSINDDLNYIKDLFNNIENDIGNLKNEIYNMKTIQKLLIFNQQIDSLNYKDKGLLRSCIKDLIYKKKFTVVDDAAFMLKDMIEDFTDLKINVDNPGFCTLDIVIVE
jgi:hypothetical protein